MDELHFNKYFSIEFYQNLSKRIVEFFENISPIYTTSYLKKQIKKESLEKKNLENSVN
jgi:hypothetical protein